MTDLEKTSLNIRPSKTIKKKIALDQQELGRKLHPTSQPCLLYQLNAWSKFQTLTFSLFRPTKEKSQAYLRR